MTGMLGKEALHRNPRLLAAGESPFSHRFGGPIGELAPDLARAPIHVLYSLDLRDPLLGFLGMEGTSLPLIFPMSVDGGTISYLCAKDGGVKLLCRTPGPREPDWPYPNYPIVFAKTPIRVRAFSYEEYRAAVFRYAMGPADWLREDDQQVLKTLGDSYTQLGGIQELPMGPPPIDYCPNPKCHWHRNCCGMWALATISNTPVPGVSLWEDADVLLVYSICSDCRAISACPMVD